MPVFSGYGGHEEGKAMPLVSAIVFLLIRSVSARLYRISQVRSEPVYPVLIGAKGR